MTRIWLGRLAAAGLLLATPTAAAADPLFGAWCDDTGYRLDISADRVTFLDAQAPHPPPGQELAFGEGVAVYLQDFRETQWPALDVVACTLTLTGPDTAVERCHGPGIGFNPFIPLTRCKTTPIS